MTAENVEIVRSFLTCLTSGDLPGAFAFVADDLTLVEADSIPHAGTFTGRDGLVQLMTKIGELFGGFELGAASYHDAGEFVVGRMEATFVSKSGAKKHRTMVAEHYWVRDGKVSYVDVYYKDPAPLLDL